MSYNILQVLKDLFTGNLQKATPDIVIERTTICNQCEVKDPIANICTACGCFLPVKVKLAKSTCPLEKW